MKVYKFEDYGILPPDRHDRWNVYVCAQESARNRTEQRRKFMVTASQSGFGSWYARRREHFNRSRESLRGPPILIRIPIFKSLEVAKISAGRKCFKMQKAEGYPGYWLAEIAFSCLLFFPRKRVTIFLKISVRFYRKYLSIERNKQWVHFLSQEHLFNYI